MKDNSAIRFDVMSIDFHSGRLSLGELRLSARHGGIAAALAVLVFVCWVAAYATGLFPWIGRESVTVSSFGAGKISIIGNQKRSNSIGFKQFYYWQGQQVMLSYSADIEAGGLRAYLVRGAGLDVDPSDIVTISESGVGELVRTIPQSGFYRWSIGPTVTRGSKGYDLSYTAAWGARPAR